MSWLTIGKTDVHYDQWGDPKAQPLVLVHGNNSCIEGWYQQIEALRETYHVYAYDSVNHGLSSNSPVGEVEPNRAEELQGFLQAMGISRPILAGHSMGAGTVLRWAVDHPSEAAALVLSGNGVAPQPEPGAPAPTPGPVETMTIEELMVPMSDAYTDRFIAEEPLKYQRYERLRSTATRIEFLRNPRTRHVYQPTGPEFETQVKAIRSPMLILVGALDAAARSARHLHELLPDSQLVEFPGYKHNFFWEAPQLYLDATEAFLAQLPAPAAVS